MAGTRSHLADRSLAWTAALLFVLAGGLWWRASSSPLTLDLTRPDPSAASPTPLAGLLLGLAVAAAAGCVFVRRVPARIAIAAVAAFSLLLTGTGVAVWWWVLPEARPTTAIGPGVSSALLGFAVAIFSCLVLALSICLRGAIWSPSSPTSSGRVSTVAVVVALTATTLVGLAVVHLDSGYRVWRNEYHSAGEVDRLAGPEHRSNLTGGSRWQLQVPGLHVAVATTPYGLVAVSGSAVVAVDTDTGAHRWRYLRADTVGDPQLMAMDGGRRVLVWWDPTSPYVLDSRTGERLARWTWPAGQTVLLGDPLIVQRPTAGGSELVQLTETGRDGWTYRLSSCDHPYAMSTGGTVLVAISDTCPPTGDRVVQLTADTGRQRWQADDVGDLLRAATSRTALFASRHDDRTVITALRLGDGTIAWRRTVEFREGRQPCNNMHTTAAGGLAMISCGYQTVDADFNERTRGILVEHDVDTGAVVRSRAYDQGIVDALAIDSAGRRIITYDSVEVGCTIRQESDQRRDEFVLHPHDDCHCSYIKVIVRGEQVILLDQLTNTISSLR